jgi:hypothetical protein
MGSEWRQTSIRDYSGVTHYIALPYLLRIISSTFVNTIYTTIYGKYANLQLLKKNKYYFPMNNIVLVKGIASGSGVISCGRIPQPVALTTTRRFYTNAIHRSNIVARSKYNNIISKNDSVPSAFRLNKGDNVIRNNRCLNVLQRPYNNHQRAMLSSASSEGGSNKTTEENPFNMRRTSNVNEDDLPPITLDNTIRMKNAALATTLVAFCFGIAYYSMHAVGQAGTGTTSTSNSDSDPLAVLKAEAAIAQEKYDKEQQDTVNTADMLEKFQKGEYDPDHVSDEELDDLIEPKKKRPWWKFW